MADLKPCPFCGSPADIDLHQGVRGLALVKCSKYKALAGCCGSTDYGTLEFVWAQWNTRPLEDAKDAEIDRRRENFETLYNDTAVELDKQDTEISLLQRLLYDVSTTLRMMGQETPNRRWWQVRWPYHHEPLRADARAQLIALKRLGVEIDED